MIDNSSARPFGDFDADRGRMVHVRETPHGVFRAVVAHDYDPSAPDSDRGCPVIQVSDYRLHGSDLRTVGGADSAARDGLPMTLPEAIGRAMQIGARLLAGGNALEGAGTFYEPTVLTDVVAGSAILREEIFGPVLAIATFADEAEAVRLANDTEYGLVSYVFTEDLRRGHRMIDALETGMMGLNVGVVSNAAAPFGGVKQSGVGREGGFEGIHEYLSTKYTLIPNS